MNHPVIEMALRYRSLRQAGKSSGEAIATAMSSVRSDNKALSAPVAIAA